MPKGHDHTQWTKEKKEKQVAWKDQRSQKEKSTSNSGGDAGKLTLSKTLAAALTTKLGVSDSDASAIIDEAMNALGKA